MVGTAPLHVHQELLHLHAVLSADLDPCSGSSRFGPVATGYGYPPSALAHYCCCAVAKHHHHGQSNRGSDHDSRTGEELKPCDFTGENSKIDLIYIHHHCPKKLSFLNSDMFV